MIRDWVAPIRGRVIVLSLGLLALGLAACGGPGSGSERSAGPASLADVEALQALEAPNRGEAQTSEASSAGGNPSPPAAATGAPSLAEAAAQLATEALGDAVADSGPIIRVSPRNLSPLYEGFFADSVALEALSGRLGVFVEAPRVDLEVQWNDRTSRGRIVLHVPETDRRGEQVAASISAEGPVDLTPIQGFMVALGHYRGEMGGRFDLRLLAFDQRLSFWDKASGTQCTIDGRSNDPEGRSFDRCFSCLDPRRGQVKVCRTEEEWPSPVEGDKSAVRRLRSALRSTPL